MEEVICRINPANSDLFARLNPANSILFAELIWQIVTYMPDNQDLEKGETPLHENFRFLTLKMDSLAKKNDRIRCLFFSSSSERLVFSAFYGEGKGEKTSFKCQILRYSSHLSLVQLLNLRLEPTNSTCTPTSQPGQNCTLIQSL